RLQVLDHREPHRLRRAEAEQARVADVERDDFVAAPLHFVSTPRQVATDFVADVCQARAGADGAHALKRFLSQRRQGAKEEEGNYILTEKNLAALRLGESLSGRPFNVPSTVTRSPQPCPLSH